MRIVFDLDGTIANTFERAYKHIACPIRGYPHTRANMDWPAYFRDCMSDTPIEATVAVARALHAAGHDVEIWTARSDMVRTETLAWLALHDVPYNRIVMRDIADRTDDNELKASWIATYGKPDLVFEDRERVVNMWRALGVQCFQVAPGTF